MKFLKTTLLFAGIISLLFSCTKTETNYGSAIGSLQTNDTTGECNPMTVYGSYTASVALNNTNNYIDVELSTTAIGTYSISTDSVNGMIFKGSGRLGYTGMNRVRLYGYGKPVLPGLTTFNVYYNGTHCTVSLIVDSSATGSFMFKDTSGNALSTPTIPGSSTYTTGVMLNAGDSVILPIFITRAGAIYLQTASINGMTFSGSGIYTTTGLHTITLSGAGIPQKDSVCNFTLTDSLSNTSAFSITVGAYGGTAAAYTLSGSPTYCGGFNQFGSYIAGVELDQGDSVTTAVIATSAGSYAIVTNQVNGVIFSGTGSFDSAGTYFVTLKGFGTPTLPGTFNYTAAGNTTNCTFSITYAQGLAVYTLGDNNEACTGTVVNGNYIASISTNTSNNVLISVNVITPGSYNIVTPKVNGIQFSASGEFYNTGTQLITLFASGIPQTFGINNYSVPSVAGPCWFTVNVIPN